MHRRVLPLSTFRRRIARRNRARLLARHMLRLLTQGNAAHMHPDLTRARAAGTPLLTRMGLMLMRAGTAPRVRHGATTLPH